jgi:hypothetical protein
MLSRIFFTIDTQYQGMEERGEAFPHRSLYIFQKIIFTVIIHFTRNPPPPTEYCFVDDDDDDTLQGVIIAGRLDDVCGERPGV